MRNYSLRNPIYAVLVREDADGETETRLVRIDGVVASASAPPLIELHLTPHAVRFVTRGVYPPDSMDRALTHAVYESLGYSVELGEDDTRILYTALESPEPIREVCIFWVRED